MEGCGLFGMDFWSLPPKIFLINWMLMVEVQHPLQVSFQNYLIVAYLLLLKEKMKKINDLSSLYVGLMFLIQLIS